MIKKIFSACMIIITFVSGANAGALDPGRKISLQFENHPLASVLNVIAQQYSLNIVQSGIVDQKVTVRLDNVDLIDALRAILNSNGYNYYFAGDILVIKPAETQVLGETMVQTITLNYISAAAAMNAVTDMLSPKGKIKIIADPASDGKKSNGPQPTQLVIIDLPEAVQKICDLIKSIDLAQPQIAIEVKMVEINVDNETRSGFTWPTSLSGRLTGIQNDASTGSTSSTSSTQSLGQVQLPDGKWEWGKLTVDEVRVVLDFLEKSGNSKLISDPRITTLNNCEAEIKVTTVIPIQTINRFSEGGAVQDIVTFQDEDIGISLLVTPHITDGNQIMLDVYPIVAEIIGYAGPEGNQKPITSERSVRTKINVASGETAVLGGLLKESKIENKQSLFVLGSIPILGNLFRHKTVQNATTDLMILITPTIVTR